LGYVSHSEYFAPTEIASLLLIQGDSEQTKVLFRVKVFEYIISTRPIIAIGQKNSDFEEIITHTVPVRFSIFQKRKS
jgi:type IV secretory pathway VirB4 component